MDPIIGGSLVIGAMLLLIASGVAVGISMASVAFVGMWALAGLPFAMGTFMTLPYSIASDYNFVVVPMFVLMGALASAAGVTTELYSAAYKLTSRLRGSLYYTTILASGAFGAISGSTVVSAVVFTRTALPEMLKFGYRKSISAGCIAGAGTFAALIPPSISMAIYGILTGQSIGRLLIAGIIPGIFTVFAYLIGMRFMLGIRPDLAPSKVERFSLWQVLLGMRGLWAVIALVVLVLGGIYTGIVAPSAAGTLGAAGALLICIVRRRLSLKGFWEAVGQAASVTAMLFLIIIGGMLLTRLLLFMGFMQTLNDLAIGSVTPFIFMAAVVAMYLVLGCFVDSVSMMVMTVPFLFPVVTSLKLDPIWFGVVVIKLVEISAITPPIGLNLFSVVSASDGAVTTSEVYRGVLPFVLIETAVLGVILAYPSLSLWLPRAMIN